MRNAAVKEGKTVNEETLQKAAKNKYEAERWKCRLDR